MKVTSSFFLLPLAAAAGGHWEVPLRFGGSFSGTSIFIFRGLHMARSESTLINTMTNSKLSDFIFQIVIALLSNPGRGSWRKVERDRESCGRDAGGNGMMKETIGALISQNVALKSQEGKKVDPTCVWHRTSQGLLTRLFWIIEMSDVGSGKLCVPKRDRERVGANEKEWGGKSLEWFIQWTRNR